MALDPAQIEFFVDNGYLVLNACLPEQTMRKWVARACERLGYDPAAPATWKREEADLPGDLALPVSELAPAAWEAICALTGGRQRIEDGEWHGWSDCFNVSYSRPGPSGETAPFEEKWTLPIFETPLAGLRAYAFWSEAAPALRVASDSLAPAAQRASLEGRFNTHELAAGCRRIADIGGAAGDVVLLHPYALYTQAPAPSGRLRFMTVRLVELREPLDFNRPSAAESSPVERAVLKGLGVSRAELKTPVVSRPAARRRRAAPAKAAPREAPRPSMVKALDDAQLRHFLEKGYLIVKECFSKKAAADAVAKACARLGCDPNDPKTWKREMVWLDATAGMPVRTFAPKAYAAICDLVGGEQRLAEGNRHLWPDAFVENFFSRKTWQPPGSSDFERWHLDGPDAPRFLDSREAGLLAFVLWTDIGPKGGGTFIACDSIAHVASRLRARPEGVPKQDLPCDARYFQDFAELTGRAGDVVLLHPFMVHTESRNASGLPRFMTARVVKLKEPMNFDRPNPKDYSPVELAVLRGLGVKRLEFKRA